MGALTRFDLGVAFDQNVLVPLAALFVVVARVTWTWAVWHAPGSSGIELRESVIIE